MEPTPRPSNVTIFDFKNDLNQIIQVVMIFLFIN